MKSNTVPDAPPPTENERVFGRIVMALLQNNFISAREMARENLELATREFESGGIHSDQHGCAADALREAERRIRASALATNEVERALAELRELLPQFKLRKLSFVQSDDTPTVSGVSILCHTKFGSSTKQGWHGATLNLAMQAVCEWKQKSLSAQQEISDVLSNDE